MTVEQRVVERLMEKMNAEVLATVEEYVPVTLSQLGRGRLAAEEQVRGCVRCHLGSRGRQMPAQVGIMDRIKVVVVLDTPDASSERAGKIDVAKNAMDLKKMCGKAGLGWSEVAWVCAVACACEPRVSMVELNACRRNLLDSLDGIDARYVMLVGQHPTLAWRTDLQVSELEGRVGIWRGKWIVMSVREPGALHRIDKGVGVESDKWRKAVYDFIDVAVQDRGISALSWGCTKRGCGDEMYGYDPDGLPWCKKHLGFGMKGSYASARRWRERVGDEQGGLFGE